jgi:RHS repeat-associated protein
MRSINRKIANLNLLLKNSEMQTAGSWTRAGATTNNFLGNGGTELNTTSNVYDLDFRNYDPALARLNQVDGLADNYSSASPYNFALNNPASQNDPTGLWMNPALWNSMIAQFATLVSQIKMADSNNGGGGTGGGAGDAVRSIGGGSLFSDAQRNFYSPMGGGDWVLTGIPGARTETDLVPVWSMNNGQLNISGYHQDQNGQWVSNYYSPWWIVFNYKGDSKIYNDKSFYTADGPMEESYFAAYKFGQGSEYQSSPTSGASQGSSSLPTIGETPTNVIGTTAGFWGGTIAWGGEEAARTAQYTAGALKIAKVSGTALGVVAFVPTAYNTVAKTINGTSNTADYLDFGVSGGLLVTGLLVSNPVGLGIIAIAGVGYGIYRIGWGDEADQAINENIGFR